MPSVTVALLNYNGVSLLKEFLPSVVNFSKGFDVAIIDNGSTDASLEYLKENFPDVRIIQLNQNYGFCRGYNEGLKQIDSDYYVLLNTDVEVTENWVEPIIHLMESDQNIAAVQPKILSYKDKSSFEYAGAAGGFIDWLGYPFCRGRIFNTLEPDQGQYDNPSKIFWASGACFFVRADLFKKAGGFCESFFAHMEEIDLCWRFQNAGYTIWCEPSSKVYHLGGGTLGKNDPRKTHLNFRNNLSTLRSNIPGYKLLLILPIRFLLDLLAALKFLFGEGFAHSLAVIKAYFTFWGSKSPQINRRNINSNGVYKGSIVFAYFLRGIRKFSQLGAFNSK